jgi:hypothetical protein
MVEMEVGIVMEAELVLADDLEAGLLVLVAVLTRVDLEVGIVMEAELVLADDLEARLLVLVPSKGVMVALPLASRVRWTLAEASRSTKTVAFALLKKAETPSSSLEESKPLIVLRLISTHFRYNMGFNYCFSPHVGAHRYL